MSTKMNEQALNFSYYGTLLSFFIERNGRIYLLYAGKDKDKIKVSRKERNYRVFVEAEIAEDPRNSHHGFKSIETAYAATYKYVSHSVKENVKGMELVIVTKNEFLEIETHYQFYKDCCGVSSFNIVKNISSAPVTMTNISSFVIHGFGKENQNIYELYQARNSWHCEAQWQKDSFYHLGIYSGNDFMGFKRYSINNTGSWSTKDFLPMMIVNNKKLKEMTLVQIENNGSWHLEVGDLRCNLYLFASGPEFYDNAWKKVLNPGDQFTSCQATVTFGNDFESVIAEITKIRRKYRRINKDNQELPVIFNDYMHALWDTQTTDLIKPLVDVAADVKCDIFCMDAGWFAQGSDWWDILGKWEEHTPNFPNGGLRAVCDYIRSKGMRPGLWIEPEAVGINSPILKEFKDGYLFKANGKDVVNSKRYILNFDNPEVYEYMKQVVITMVTKYDLAYIKTDYNTDAGVGNEWNADSLGDGLLKHNRAYVRWLNEIMDMFPDLTIENCGSGGCRMDNELLKYCPIQSTSDQTNFLKYPYLSANVLTATTPEQAAVWSYPVNAYIKDYMPDDEAVIMNMCNAMLGRIHLASFINKLPENQLKLIREGVDYFNSISDLKIKSVPVFPNGTAQFFDKEVVGGIKADGKIILGVWNTSKKPRVVKVKLAKYDVKSIQVGYPKNEKTNFAFDEESKILTVTFDHKYGGRIFELKY